LLCIRYGEIINVNLVRDKDTGKSKGFAFLCYEDQRSTILAVDNLNGAKVGACVFCCKLTAKRCLMTTCTPPVQVLGLCSCLCVKWVVLLMHNSNVAGFTYIGPCLINCGALLLFPSLFCCLAVQFYGCPCKNVCSSCILLNFEHYL